jgi:type II secretory pathway predicted ATPase ExeA
MMKKKRLTAEERHELQTWTLPRIDFPIHADIRYQLQRGLEGAEHTLLIGPPGAGKTDAVASQLEDLTASAMDRVLDDPNAQVPSFLSYTSSTAVGPKTGLVDLATHLMPSLSPGVKRRSTPTYLVQLCADECRARGIRLLVIDEAHRIGAEQLDQLRQVSDYTAERLKYPLAFFLIGNEPLRSSLAEIKQLGQRFSAVISMTRCQPSDIAPYWADMHPHVARLKKTATAADWRVLTDEVLGCVRGSLRRLGRGLENANALALHLDQPIEADLLRMVLGGLSGEA